MCGIAGVWKQGQSQMWLERSAKEMAAQIRHRGPDAEGVWADAAAGIALGHQRLSILDLSSNGAQPMQSASGRYVISYNGEVYNFSDLRRELEVVGASFRGGSDTEVILAAIESWGIDEALRKFIGMFAFALWDRSSRELHLIRDRIGIKPLFWGQFGSQFMFGSELSALTACPGWTPEIDRDALRSYARWNYVPTPHSIYRGIAKLEPGTRLTMKEGGKPEVVRYWDFRKFVATAEPMDLDDEEAADELEKVLRDAVRRRLVSDVPLGAFLSGGVDSSLVVALMQSESDHPVRSFTIGFRDPRYNEAKYAKQTAGILNTAHSEIYVEAEDVLALIPEMPGIYDEPFADSSQLPTTILSRLTRQQVTVALSGDGGDELFAGYTRYHWAELVRNRFLVLPAMARKALAATIDAPPQRFWAMAAKFMPGLRRMPRVGERAAKLASFLREEDEDAIYLRQHTQWDRPDLAVPRAKELDGILSDQQLRREIPDFLQRMQFLDTVTYLPDDILTKVDRASMSVGLEARIPLLDHRVVEFAWRLPRRMKVRDGTDKWLLRKILHRHVPPPRLGRPKMGFSVPLAHWLRGPLREWAGDLLSPSRLHAADYFDPHEVARAWRRLQGGDGSSQEAIWGVLMFEAWRQERKRAFEAPMGAG